MAVAARYTEQLVVMVSKATKDAIRARSDQRGISDADVVRPYLDAGLEGDPLVAPETEG
jgi:hypothetical protein